MGRTGTLLGVITALTVKNSEDLLVGGKAPEAILREDQLSLTPDLEDATATAYQFDLDIAVACL